ncbi:hypothetical protein KPH14_004580 [Odynerus spinipes]|uniref:Uncharacterized protein n=1 Tax=Odynerus spinipes TaxID=1348599 RepID=A0AAD9RN57_9HYME|nr:hypothetical protein KPH14_004580 [Odynerus spinipes]
MVQNKATQAPGKLQTNIIVIEKKRRKLSIPKDLNLVDCWNIMGPEIAEEFGEGYSHIPYCLESNAYKIGNIFVPAEVQVKCFRATEIVKILGPLVNFAIKSKTNSKFLNPSVTPVKRQPDAPNLQVILANKKRELVFTGYNCQFLDKPVDMVVEANITIDRSSHPDLAEAKWFGLITGVFVTKNFELRVQREQFSRTMYIGEEMQTLLFKYEICWINTNGYVINTTKKKTDMRWASIMEHPSDSLPLPKLAVISK